LLILKRGVRGLGVREIKKMHELGITQNIVAIVSENAGDVPVKK
jgi:hypothetical protein